MLSRKSPLDKETKLGVQKCYTSFLNAIFTVALLEGALTAAKSCL